MIGEHIVPQPEVIMANLLADSPCWGPAPSLSSGQPFTESSCSVGNRARAATAIPDSNAHLPTKEMTGR